MSVIVDYTSKDYDGFRSSMLDYATTAYPEWQPGSVADFGVMMIEAFAYMGDILSYYGDRTQQEAYLGTATQRRSILAIAEMLGYIPGDRSAAEGTVALTNGSGDDIVVPKGTKFLTGYVASIDGPLIFEATEATTIPANDSADVPVAEGETKGDTVFSVFGESVTVIEIGNVSGTVGQEFTVPDCPVIDDSLRIFVDTVTLSGDDVDEYTRFPHIIDATPSDKAYQYRKDDKGIVTVVLGDGVNGILPPVGNRVWAAYRVGGGDIGNLAADAITTFGDPIADLTIAGSSATEGGTVEESNSEIRTNAPLAYRTQDRAVTLDDFADLALAVPSVGKASAVSESFTSVTVYLLATAGALPGASLLTSTASYLQDRALAGVTVTTAAASIVAVNIGSEPGDETVIGVDDRFVQANVQEAVNQALLTYLDPANRDFGERLSLSDIYTVITGVAGVKYATVNLMAREDAAQSGTDDIQFQPWEIPTAGEFGFTAVGGIV